MFHVAIRGASYPSELNKLLEVLRDTLQLDELFVPDKWYKDDGFVWFAGTKQALSSAAPNEDGFIEVGHQLGLDFSGA